LGKNEASNGTPSDKGKEYSKNYSRKYLSCSHSSAAKKQRNQQLLHQNKKVLPSLQVALTSKVFKGILPRVRALFVKKGKSIVKGPFTRDVNFNVYIALKKIQFIEILTL